MEVELKGLKGFVYLRGSLKSNKQCGGLVVEVMHRNGDRKEYRVPVTLKGSIKYVLRLGKDADRLYITGCNQDDEISLEVEKLNFFMVIHELYGYLLSLYFKGDVLKKSIIDNIGYNFLEALISPYKVYQKGQYLTFIRNRGFFNVEGYDDYFRNYLWSLQSTNGSKTTFAGVVLSWNGGDTKSSIDSLIGANFGEIFIQEEDVDVQELLEKSTSDYFLFIFSGDKVKDYSVRFLELFVRKKNFPEVFYCDHINSNGTIFFKPDWSYYYYIHFDYISNSLFFKRETLKHLGKIKKEPGAYAVFDALLRLNRFHNLVPEHLPVPLLEKSYSEPDWDKGLEVLRSFIQVGNIEKYTKPNTFIYIPPLEEEPYILIIIPTKDKSDLLRKCVFSILEKTTYRNYRIMVVNNSSTEEETYKLFSELKNFDNIEIVDYNMPYNFSKIVNFAIEKSTEEFIVLLNNDTEVLSEDWLQWMVRYLGLKDVGVVGARLFYPDLSIQHAGVVVGLFGCADHAFKGYTDDRDYMNRISLVQEYLAVTAACMSFKRSVFKEVGGFDEELAVNFNDLDFCLKVYTKGYKVLYLPQVQLIHHEHATRGKVDSPEKVKLAKMEKNIILSRWKNLVEHDPYYNPNLSLYRRDFSPATPRFHWLE